MICVTRNVEESQMFSGDSINNCNKPVGLFIYPARFLIGFSCLVKSDNIESGILQLNKNATECQFIYLNRKGDDN